MNIKEQRELKVLHERFKLFNHNELFYEIIIQVKQKEFGFSYAMANLENREKQLRAANVSFSTFINDQRRSYMIDRLNEVTEQLTDLRERFKSLSLYIKHLETMELSKTDNPFFILELQ